MHITTDDAGRDSPTSAFTVLSVVAPHPSISTRPITPPGLPITDEIIVLPTLEDNIGPQHQRNILPGDVTEFKSQQEVEKNFILRLEDQVSFPLKLIPSKQSLLLRMSNIINYVLEDTFVSRRPTAVALQLAENVWCRPLSVSSDLYRDLTCACHPIKTLYTYCFGLQLWL